VGQEREAGLQVWLLCTLNVFAAVAEVEGILVKKLVYDSFVASASFLCSFPYNLELFA